jgi:hypothetical protein
MFDVPSSGTERREQRNWKKYGRNQLLTKILKG